MKKSLNYEMKRKPVGSGPMNPTVEFEELLLALAQAAKIAPAHSAVKIGWEILTGLVSVTVSWKEDE